MGDGLQRIEFIQQIIKGLPPGVNVCVGLRLSRIQEVVQRVEAVQRLGGQRQVRRTRAATDAGGPEVVQSVQRAGRGAAAREGVQGVELADGRAEEGRGQLGCRGGQRRGDRAVAGGSPAWD